MRDMINRKCLQVKIYFLSFKSSTWIYGSYAPPGTGESRITNCLSNKGQFLICGMNEI